jgi:hypothetical protein
MNVIAVPARDIPCTRLSPCRAALDKHQLKNETLH